MEIVLAVLLLFGGFALGSATADKRDDVEPSSMTVPSAKDVSDSALAMQEMRGCLPDKSGMYRDLTVPYRVPIERPAGEGSDCDGECPNE